MDSHDTDRAIAKILGLTVVSLTEPGNPNKDREFVEGHLYEEPYRSRLYRHPAHAFQEGLEWSPSCNPADALAALEAWCDSHDVGWSLGGNLGFYRCYIQFPGERVEMAGGTKETLICATILAAEAANG